MKGRNRGSMERMEEWSEGCGRNRGSMEIEVIKESFE